ncbi:MAG: hypothetical protein K2N78_06000 [Oscillospiraceae bacterium]|nr:hypothetical protein [Oscillospiraceae bacterium]
MAACRIEKKQVKAGIQYIDCHGRTAGMYCYKKTFSTRYEAVTFHDGREQYVLKMRDFRILLVPVILFGGFLPKGAQLILVIFIVAALLFLPRLPAIWMDGKLLAKKDCKNRFFTAQDCYEFHHHSGYKTSLMKNGEQIALYTMKTSYGVSNPPYEVLYDERVPLDIIILFCVYLDVSGDYSRPRGATPWKSWVPWDRYWAQTTWQPPEPCRPTPAEPSTTSLPSDSTD